MAATWGQRGLKDSAKFSSNAPPFLEPPPSTRGSACAWPYVLELVRDKLPTARLFPEEWSERPDRLTLAHAETQRALKLPIYTLHHARHHWAATRLREGWPIADVQQQLGHSTPMLTLTTYGAFISDVRRRRELERARTQRNVVGAPLGAPPSGTA